MLITDTCRTMRVLFLNQYFPPDPAPTGILFREIAEACMARGHTVDFIDAALDYRGGQQRGGRLRRELTSLWRIAQRGKEPSHRTDVVVSGTSPPCLAVVADHIARKHGARHLHWAMDLYPELATALGEIRPTSPIAAFTRWLMRRAYRRAAAVVALDTDMQTHLAQHYGITPVIIRPWVFASVLPTIPTTPIPPEQPPVWIYSGNLGRAHEWKTLLEAQSHIERDGGSLRLRFQGGGPSWAAAQAMSERLALRAVEFRGYVPEADLPTTLLRGSALAVTQLPAARSLLWPSKLGLLLALPRPILFVGDPDSAIARDLGAYPHAKVFAPGDAHGVAQWLRQLPPVNAPVINPAIHRTESLSTWLSIIEQR